MKAKGSGLTGDALGPATDNQPTEIKAPAQIAKVQTLVDGGLRVTVDLAEDQVLAAAHLMECKRRGVPGWLIFRPDWDVLKEQSNEGESQRNHERIHV